ncbi:MAG: hypothetical protein SXV54_19835 [Chloroflexota bacterium]|nr:hypothetical protein [Chloroflexota bacterium]
MSESEIIADAKIAAAIRGQAQEGKLRCAAAFRIAEELDMTPLAVGQTADALEVRLARCQLGLFGYGEQRSVVEPADDVEPELEQAIREGLILERLPCAVAWAIASRFRMPKLHVANATEKLGIHIGQCQLGAFEAKTKVKG